jgi:hypothetical protein
VSLGTSSSMTPVQRHLLFHGGAGSPVPRDAEQTTLTVRDEKGLDCESAKYPLLALRSLGEKDSPQKEGRAVERQM